MSSNQNINLKVEQRISDSTNDRQVVYNSYSSNGGNGSNCNRSVNYFGQPQSQSLENNRDAILIEQLHMSESSTSTNDRKKKQSNSKFATSESDDYYSDDYDDEENEDDDDEENGDSRTVKKSKGSNGSPTNKSRRSETSSAKAKNREHAKNTRQRKKNYIESLKDSVRLLAEERDLVDRERKNQLSRLAEKVSIFRYCESIVISVLFLPI